MGGSRHEEQVEAALRLLFVADPSSCGDRELDTLAGALQRLRGYVAAYDVAIARRRDELAAAPFGGGLGADGASTAGTGPTAPPSTGADASDPELPTPSGTPLDPSGFEGVRDRRPGRDADQDRARARVCSLLPTFEAALADGRIDAAHVDAVAAAWRDLDEEERRELSAHAPTLLGHAAAETPERFRRRVRDLARRIASDHGVRVAERQRTAASVRRWIDARTGMSHLHAELDPERAALVWSALDERLGVVKLREHTAGRSLQHLEVDALVELVTASSALDLRAAAVCVHVDLATLQTGVFGEGSVCETSDGTALPPASVRRMACDGMILPVVLGGDGVPLDVGRSRRLATREQRVSLAAMYATCGVPGCGVRFERCRIHHLDPWLPTGPTDLANLLPLCDRHHHQVHGGGWTLTMTPDRTITLRSPDGTVRHHGDSRDRIAADRLHEVVPSTSAGIDTEHCRAADDDRQQFVAVRLRVAELVRRRCRTDRVASRSASAHRVTGDADTDAVR